MEKPQTYCAAVKLMDASNVHVRYHDEFYGFPVDHDNQLFERLVLEINQAGLSWTTILKKQDNFRKAFHGFDIATVAAYDGAERSRLLQDAGIIRNRLKIDAAIHNAKVILQLQEEFGSFKDWLNHHHPKQLKDWTKLFKQIFKFTGGEITNEFLVSTGYLPGAHELSCPIHNIIAGKKPAWQKESDFFSHPA